MEEALMQLQAKDTKERVAGVERLQTVLEQCRKRLTAAEVCILVDASLPLLKDNNFRVAQGALQALVSAAALAGDHLKLHFNALLPASVERLGDTKQPVRDAGRRFLLALMEISSPIYIFERAGACAWGHKNWRVREEFARTAASALNLFTATELPFQRLILPSVLHLLEDSSSNVREAAMLCLEEMYRQGGQHFRDELQRHQLRTSQFKEVTARFEKIEPVRSIFDSKQNSSLIQCITSPNQFSAAPNQNKSISQQAATDHHWAVSELKVPVLGGITRGNSPMSKPFVEGDNIMIENPAKLVRVFSEKDLAKEFEKAKIMLLPAQDWSVRVSAMQRIAGIVAGGATKYNGFLHLLKQLVNPLCDQLADRRSSVVKQACQLLKVLAKELKSEFEAFADSFLPVLFKLVVITVLVIAESAHACIKSILQYCRVARVLPKMAELSKHDRNAVLRARCCEYLLLVLEQWSDSPEMQRSAELYEDLIKCCCGDSMSEVRSFARQCYRAFARCWPDRTRRLYQSLDHVTQKVINDEDGGILKYGHSAAHDACCTLRFRHSTGLPILSAGHSTIPSGLLNSSDGTHVGSMNGVNTNLVSKSASSVLQRKSTEVAPERNLENVLQANQQQVNAFETILKGVAVEDRESNYSQTAGEDTYLKIHSTGATWASRPGVDMPSSRDTSHQASGPVVYHQPNLSALRPRSVERALSGHQAFDDMDAGRSTDFSGISREAEPADGINHDSAQDLGRSQSANRVQTTLEKFSSRSSNVDNEEVEQSKRIPKLEGNMDGLKVDVNSYAVPRPLLRPTGSGRSSGSGQGSLDDSLSTVITNSCGEVLTCMNGLMSLNDALTEGLTPGSDWSARVGAFTFLKKLLQQGSRGLQEIGQNFERVMRLFSEHLVDPHHKVSQAALSSIIELVPAFRRLFETYLERILPYIFARLVDSKEVIRQLSASALEAVENVYSIDALLPALIRSLDEQRSPKAKMAVIEFTSAAFAKLALNGVASGGSGLLKLWLAKLAPLVHNKNAKLKETAVTGLISVYSHFDSAIVLNFILGISIDEQSALRRAIKHYNPRLEVDLMNYMQSRSQRNKTKVGHDQSSTHSTLGEKDENYMEQVVSAGDSHQTAAAGYPSVDLCNMDRKWVATAQRDTMNVHYQEGLGIVANSGDLCFNDLTAYMHDKAEKTSYHYQMDTKFVDPGSDIPNGVLQMLIWDRGKSITTKESTLQQLMELSHRKDSDTWSKYYNQIITLVLEALHDPESTIRGLAASVMLDMLKNQKDRLNKDAEVLLEILLQSARDPDQKVSAASDSCLNAVLTELDPYRCLSVIVPHLESENEKTLIICIGCLTKIVSRLPSEELVSQLSSFLPMLFDAFGNQNAAVRKTVIFCLVEIYIVLGKAFVPYLGSLNSTQLRLVIINANRIFQARMRSESQPTLKP